MGLTNNIVYSWWCPHCLVEHHTPNCPDDDNSIYLYCDGDQNINIEICPCCGQVIKRYVIHGKYFILEAT